MLTFWIVMLMLAVWRIYAHLYPRTDATAAFFEDLTSPVDRRAESSLVLTRTLLNHLQNPSLLDVATLEMDMMPGSEEPGFGGLQSSLNTYPIDGFALSDRPMKLSGFEFTLRDIAAAAAGLLSRPRGANLTGWLSETEQGLIAYAELSDRQDPGKNRSWRIQAPTGSRTEKIIDDLSAQILVDTGNSKLTHNWKSLRAFRRAIGLRQSAGYRTRADLLLARHYLEEAVTFDASNWIARFNLALTLCRCGEPEIGLQHFRLLDEVIRMAWRSNQDPDAPCPSTPAFQGVKEHLHKHPECAFLILYNKAIALAALHRRETTIAATTELRRLASLRLDTGASGYDDPHRSLARTLTPRAQTELSLYALSAEATVLAASTQRRPQRSESEIETGGLVNALLKTVEDLCAATQERHWRSVQTARAITRAAAARVAASQGETGAAREHLEAAIAAEPGFVEAYLSLAELHIDTKEGCDNNWERRADALLTRALELAPECSRAMFLLTRLTATPSRATSSALL